MSGSEEPESRVERLERMAGELEAHPDYRVLRRLRPIERRSALPVDRTCTGMVVDVETEGLDPGTCRIVELAMQRFRFDDEGRIVETFPVHHWFEDPGRPLSDTIKRITRLSDEDVVGRSIADGEAGCLLVDSRVVIAHNASFDRPFVERRLGMEDVPWACSLNEVPWADMEFDGRSLGQLLAGRGLFFTAHRASADVAALLVLLDQEIGGRTVLSRLLDRASEETWRIDAVAAPFAAKDSLRLRGYRWNADRRVWSREVATEDRDAELVWAADEVYQGVRAPDATRVTWRDRWSDRA